MKENRPEIFFNNQVPINKDVAYTRAITYWEKADAANAEDWAVKAMRLGSRNAAPKLLAEIALATQSKSTAITLASYYWEMTNIKNALYWAKLAKEYGSNKLADKLISEIKAHIIAINIHDEVGRLSK
jgi:hypothetical protein